MSTQNQQDPYKLVIFGRLSFPNLHKPRQQTGKDGKPQGEPKFGCSILLDKESDAETIKKIKGVIRQVCLDKWDGKEVKIKTSGAKLTDGAKGKIMLDGIALRDGVEKDDKEGYGDGVTFVPASSLRKPKVVRPSEGGGLEVIENMGDKNDPYPGCYVKASIRFWAQDNDYGKRVNCELLAVCFIKDGESLGGATNVNVDEEFAEEAAGGGAPAKPAASSDDW